MSGIMNTHGPWFIGAAERKWHAQSDEAPGGTVCVTVSARNLADPVALVVGAYAIHGIEKLVEAHATLIATCPDLLQEHLNRVSDLMLLRRAIDSADPKAELLLRVDDMLRDTRAVIDRATKVQP